MPKIPYMDNKTGFTFNFNEIMPDTATTPSLPKEANKETSHFMYSKSNAKIYDRLYTLILLTNAHFLKMQIDFGQGLLCCQRQGQLSLVPQTQKQ